jgi:hypothetical protein
MNKKIIIAILIAVYFILPMIMVRVIVPNETDNYNSIVINKIEETYTSLYFIPIAASVWGWGAFAGTDVDPKITPYFLFALAVASWATLIFVIKNWRKPPKGIIAILLLLLLNEMFILYLLYQTYYFTRYAS